MRFLLGHLHVELQSQSPIIRQELSRILCGSYDKPSLEDRRFSERGTSDPTDAVDLHIQLNESEQLPKVPAGPPPTIIQSHHLPGELNRIVIHNQDDEIWFHFLDGALLHIVGGMPSEGKYGQGRVTGLVLPALLHGGRLEDLVYAGLAPLLRRRGYYLAHAFAAERDGRAILLAGPSGSGKTTAGLSLISAGWRFLANDVVLLRRLGDTVFALPTPGGIGLTAQTIRMIPSLAAQLRELRLDRFKGKEYLPADEVVSGWGQAAAVATVLFPEITKRDRIQTVPCGKAVTLARLMESSLDRWDEFSLPGHIDLLQILSGQATGYRVYLGRGMSYFPESLAAIW